MVCRLCKNITWYYITSLSYISVFHKCLAGIEAGASETERLGVLGKDQLRERRLARP